MTRQQARLRGPSAALALVLALALPAAGAAQAARPRPGPAVKPRAERAVPFAVGETLTYDVAWSSFLVAGSATVTVRERRQAGGSTSWVIVAEGQPIPLVARLYPVYYKVDTLLDAVTLLPRRSSFYGKEGGDQTTRVTTYEQAARRATYEVFDARPTRERLTLRGNTYDPLAAIYVARTATLRAGHVITMAVADGGDLYDLQLSVEGVERVRTGLGSVEAWKLVPRFLDARGRDKFSAGMALWISTDARRLPLKLQATLAVGTFDLTVREAGGAAAPGAR